MGVGGAHADGDGGACMCAYVSSGQFAWGPKLSICRWVVELHHKGCPPSHFNRYYAELLSQEAGGSLGPADGLGRRLYIKNLRQDVKPQQLEAVFRR